MQLIGNNIVLRTVKIADAHFILNLRLDSTLSKHISRTDNDVKKQIDWIEQYKLREKQGLEYYFIVVDRKRAIDIGTIRLHDFSGDQFTSGSYILKREAPYHLFIETYQICLDYGFEKLGFENCFFAIRKNNQKYINFNLMFGSQKCGQDEKTLFFRLSRDMFKAKRAKMLSLIQLSVKDVRYRIIGD